jgi:hypothetical protein
MVGDMLATMRSSSSSSSSASGALRAARALRLLGSLLLVAPLSVRCTSPTAADPLVRFDTCEELQGFLEERILHPGRGAGVIVGCAPEALLAVPADGGAEGEGERVFTTTNTQEADVDEPDFVKNDGDHIFVLHKDRMVIVDAWPPTEASIVSETLIDGAPFSMFFDGHDRALVLARNPDTWWGTRAFLFDVVNRAAPVLRRTVDIDARYVDARRVGDDVVLVTQSYVESENYARQGPFRDDENRAALREVGLDGMVPRLTDSIDGGQKQVRPAVVCENTYAPTNTPSLDLLLVHTISLADESAAIKSTSVVGAPGSVYASTKNLYLVGTEYFDGGYYTPDFGVTRIHKLGAFDGARAPYLGSITLEGFVKDELSLDEDEDSGTLRVVLTDRDPSEWDPVGTETSLVVVQEADDLRLQEIGRVGDIGHGEVVESVRFVGDRAYVVTFPPDAAEFDISVDGWPTVPFIDPLFVVDLRDPANPVLRGELEVEGYSAYLHPLDDDHLLAVGVRVDAETGAFQGLKLQMFDVADADAPRLLHSLPFGDENSGSQALVDRHAFTYFAAQKKLGIPYQRVADGFAVQSSLLVFDVDVEQGLTFFGAVDQLPLWSETLGGLDAANAPCGTVQRSIMMDDEELGPWVYAVSSLGLSIAPLVQGTPEARTVPFPDVTACEIASFWEGE